MVIYELDDYDPWEDEYIETLYFPNCSVVLECDLDRCYEVRSNWKNVSGRDYGTWQTNAKIRLKAWGQLVEP